MQKLRKKLLTLDQEITVRNQLRFIHDISSKTLKRGYRSIISGGYAVDGALGEITRQHNDIDIQIYGKDIMNSALLESIILDTLPSYHGKMHIEDQGRFEYWHKFFIHDNGAEVYYIQVATQPFNDFKVVIKSDGTYTEEQEYETKMVYLQGIGFEAQNPIIELADKTFNRDFQRDVRQEKHDQDIYNLRLITDFYDVQQKLEKMKRQTTS